MQNTQEIFSDSYQRILRRGKARQFFALISELALSNTTIQPVLDKQTSDALEKKIHIAIIVLINYSIYHVSEERFDLDAELFLNHSPPLMHPDIAKAWVDCIHEAVKCIDDQYSESVWHAWVDTLTPGINRLKRHYYQYIEEKKIDIEQPHY